MKMLQFSLVVVCFSLCQFVSAKSETQQRPELTHGWITIGDDVVQPLSKHSHLLSRLEFVPFKKANQNGVAIAKIQLNAIDQLSKYMHDAHRRCGGFIFHDSLANAKAYVEQSINNQSSGNALQQVNYTIDNPSGVNVLLAELTKATMSATVNQLTTYNNRYYTQQSGVNAVNWIKNEWQSISNGRSDISVELVNHSWNQPSVMATVTGTTFPDEVVIIGGHLDSINSSSPSTGRAPGADDNASGIAVATETLRAMVASDFKPQRTVKFFGYAAEEVGLRGSKAIARDFKNNNINVVGVVQFDMTGRKGTATRDVVFITDYTNAAQNNFMQQLMDEYLTDLTYGTSRCGYGCSDHAAWHNEGFVASFPFESTFNDSNRQIHTRNDTSYDVDHSFNFARLSATYVAELAKGGDGTNPPPPPPPPPPPNELQNGVPVGNLSATQGNDVVYTLRMPADARDITFTISGGTGDADLYTRFGSEPTDSQYDCRPYRNGNNETCAGSQIDGIYYVRVKAYRTFSGVTLTGSYTQGGQVDPIDDTYTGINLDRGEWVFYSVDLSGGYGDLVVTLSGGTGDADLYVREGSQPTMSSYDCRPYRNGNSETCSFTSPGNSIWHIGIRGYRASTNVTVNIKANP